MDKIKSVLKTWKGRQLSLIGKVTVINTLIASLFVHKMLVLPRIPDNLVKIIESWLSEFIWNGAKPKIPLRVLKLHKSAGGLNLTDLSVRDIALKCTWIQKLQQDSKCQGVAYKLFSPIMKEDIFKCNFVSEDVEDFMDQEKSPFWFSMLQAWATYQRTQIDDEDPFMQTVWLNTHIKIDKKVLWNKEAYESGLLWVSQLYEEGVLISVRAACEKFKLSFMLFYSIVTSLPTQWRQRLRGHGSPNRSVYQLALKNKKLAKLCV